MASSAFIEGKIKLSQNKQIVKFVSLIIKMIHRERSEDFLFWDFIRKSFGIFVVLLKFRVGCYTETYLFP